MTLRHNATHARFDTDKHVAEFMRYCMCTRTTWNVSNTMLMGLSLKYTRPSVGCE